MARSSRARQSRPQNLVWLLLLIGFGIFKGCQKQAEQTAPQRPTRTTRTPTGKSPKRAPQSPKSSRPSSGQALTALPADADNSNILLGMPSRAAKNPDDFLVERPQFVMSYNKSDGGPNWVSWHLDASTLGDVQRGNFRPDPLLPPDWQIRPNDYRASGYDRGHVCPSGDRTATEEDNDATFVMSNMLPQTAALNQHLWKSLEDYSRELVSQGNELYVVAGGIGSAERIGGGKVNVPKQCWKVAVVLPDGDGDLSRIDGNTRVIAVLMPNQQSDAVAQAEWSQYSTSVAQIEKATGLDFFAELPASVRRKLESKSKG